MIQKETVQGLLVILGIIIALIIFRTISIDIPKANELHEIYAPCPTCYRAVYGINDEVVCRYTDCLAYGLPQKTMWS